jgi:hypothetical protein
MHRLTAMTLCALFAASCASEGSTEELVTIDTLAGGIPRVFSSGPTEEGRWKLVHDFDLQPALGTEGELFNPQDLSLGDDGRIYVSEDNPPIVKVFSPDGKFIRTIGGEGDGPGEMRVAFIAARGDTLVVQDPQNIRATSFNVSDGSVISIRPTVCCHWHRITIDDSGRAVARMAANGGVGPGSPGGFLRFPIGGTAAESLVVMAPALEEEPKRWEVNGAQFSFRRNAPLQPQPNHAPLPNGRFVAGTSNSYWLRVTANGTDTIMVFGRPETRAVVNGTEKQALVDAIVEQTLVNMPGTEETALRESFDKSSIPDVRPAWETFWSDAAGRVWVRLSSPDTLAMHLDLFDSSGRWLDTVSIAEPLLATTTYRPMFWGHDRVAFSLQDEDGLPLVRIYRLERVGT